MPKTYIRHSVKRKKDKLDYLDFQLNKDEQNAKKNRRKKEKVKYLIKRKKDQFPGKQVSCNHIH